jgi:phosphatidylglycerol:prolipoprotein diacylglycerol transferase
MGIYDYQHIPMLINPTVFSVGFFSLRWYGLMYLFGFLVVYIGLKVRIRRGEFPPTIFGNKIAVKTQQSKSLLLVQDFLLVTFFCALIGGRLGYVVFYNLQYYAAHPMAIFLPYDFYSAQYVGIFGMSYHGALVAIILGSYFFLKKRKISFFVWADFVVPTVSLGYFFGRMGNFLNGELYGRITQSSLGMYFADDKYYLRHPSQLYEALLEGILLFVIFWSMRNKKMQQGIFFGMYLCGYGLVRIFVEQFRQPDLQLGLLWNLLSMGQLLSVVMIGVGLYILIWKNKK